MAQIYQGQLYKYTNVVKGWQYRWFILKPESGILEYYLATQADEAKFQRPRGLIPLSGAVVSPSEEDSNTFTVNSSNGEIYKLRGINAKERQEWVDRLRAVAEHHAQASNLVAAQNTNREPWPNVPNVPAISNPQVPPSLSSSSSSQHGHRHHNRRSPPEHVQQQQHVTDGKQQQQQQNNPSARAQQRVMENTRSIYDAFSAAQEILVTAEYGHHTLAKAIEDLPNHGPDVRCVDPDMLLLKATSQATLLCLKQCHAMLQQQQQAASFSQTGVTGGAMMEWLDPFSYSLNWNNANAMIENATSSPTGSSLQVSIIADNNDHNININSEDEKTDDEDFADLEMSSAEEHRALTLQLLSQFKLGMDLTRVVLPAFILEPRSLLEMYSDLMKHPDIFIKIPKEISPEARMMAVVEWYLTAFNLGRKGGFSANKPYNPIIGELFFCSWIVDDSTDDSGGCDGDNNSMTDKRHKLKFVAEQVSHHPPISAFYVESSDHDICLNASIATKSKFMGMSVAVNIVGEAVLSIPQYEEEYTITFPSAYARSVLSTPWVELCGKTSITCNKTGYSASVTFHTKPFYGGKLHRVTAEVKNSNGGTICKVQGEWNGVLEFMCANGESKFIDTTSLAVYRKRVKPVNLQAELESRKVWRHVTRALKDDDIASAAENKRMIEECQRYKSRQWQETGHHFSPRFFQMVEDCWQYNDHLKIKNYES